MWPASPRSPTPTWLIRRVWALTRVFGSGGPSAGRAVAVRCGPAGRVAPDRGVHEEAVSTSHPHALASHTPPTLEILRRHRRVAATRPRPWVDGTPTAESRSSSTPSVGARRPTQLLVPQLPGRGRHGSPSQHLHRPRTRPQSGPVFRDPAVRSVVELFLTDPATGKNATACIGIRDFLEKQEGRAGPLPANRWIYAIPRPCHVPLPSTPCWTTCLIPLWPSCDWVRHRVRSFRLARDETAAGVGRFQRRTRIGAGARRLACWPDAHPLCVGVALASYLHKVVAVVCLVRPGRRS